MIDNKSNTSFYKQIESDIESRIVSAKLPPGAKVPSVRKFAKFYGASVCTVHNALEELKYRGILESKANSGYYVSYDGWNTLFPDTPDWDKYMKLSWMQEQPVEMDSSCGSNRALLTSYIIGEHFGAKRYLKKAMANCLDVEKSFSNDDTDYRGSLSLRGVLSKHMLRYGIKAEPDEILITSGALSSLSLIRFAIMRSGMGFICENCFTLKLNPTYPSLGINKIGLPTDNDGIILDKLAQVLQKNKQNVVCSTFGGVSPYADDKTFGVSSITRKKAILKLCNATRTPIIEVDEFRDLLFEPATHPLKSLDDVHSVLYVGSLTKSFMSNFRIGWVIGQKEVIKKMAKLRMLIEGEQNFILQEIAAELIGSGLYYEYLDELKGKLKEYPYKINTIFEKHLTGLASYNINSITRGIYLKFIDEIDMYKMYENRGSIQFTPGYFLDKEWEQYIRISATSMNLDDFETSIKQLSILAKKSFR